MPIHHLIYCCPFCYCKTSVTEEDMATCENCCTSFSRISGSRILVRPRPALSTLLRVFDAPDNSWAWPTSAASLIHKIDGSLRVLDKTLAGNSVLRSEAILGTVSEYMPVYSGRELMGYTEIIEENESGFVVLGETLDLETLDFMDGERLLHSWRLDQVKSLLISSTALQVYIKHEGMYQIGLINDSPKQWEDLLRSRIDQFYREKGLEVYAYMPVIRTRRITT